MIEMKVEELLCKLISINSVTENELEVLDFTSQFLEAQGFDVLKLPVANNRYNIFTKIGNPTVCFTTHLDVVPADSHQFIPKIIGGRIIGRGACDAKGMAASMICAALELKNTGVSNFAILFVVGEETDGIGAISAAIQLKDSGIKYLVNGEPTEGRLVDGHKGAITFEIKFTGKACHSGYPEAGVDANLLLIDVAKKLYETDFGYDEVFGKSTINLGSIVAGQASNIVSDRGIIRGIVRTVTNNLDVFSKIQEIVLGYGELVMIADAPKITLKTLSGFKGGIVNYCSDLPHFLPLACEMLMYGPGTIFEAHTNHESVGIDELHQAKADYEKIAKLLLE